MVDGKKRGFLAKRRKPKWSTLIIVGLAHIVALFAIASALAPKWTSSVVDDVESLVTVTITAPPETTPDPDVEPEPDEGGSAPEAAKAKPKEVTAPKPKITPKSTPVPKASSDGNENNSGAGERGDGSGGGGQGDGTGSGRGGDGQGNGKPPLVPVTKPSVRSGNLDNARDFPRPEGGRKTRFGKSVTVHFTVTTDGRARNCSVASSGVDAQATGLVCSLVAQKVRFNPAKDRNGNPIEARYGYRVDFKRR